jgi:hypothetical protein
MCIYVYRQQGLGVPEVRQVRTNHIGFKVVSSSLEVYALFDKGIFMQVVVVEERHFIDK